MARRKKKHIKATDPCPCGSGKPYIECCIDKGFEFVEDRNGKVSKRMKFRQKSKNKDPNSEKDFSGEILCKKSAKFSSIEDVPEELRKAGMIYRVGVDFSDIPRKDLRSIIPIIGIDFSDGDFSLIRSLFFPKVTLKDLRSLYEIIESEKLRASTFLGDPDLRDEPSSEMSDLEDVLVMVVTKDYCRHFNVVEDYGPFGSEIIHSLVTFFEGTKLEILLEIIRRSMSDGLARTIFTDI